MNTKNETKFTPGPWYFSETQRHNAGIYRPMTDPKQPHNHESFEQSCPACGLAPRQTQPLVPWGFEHLTKHLAPCVCGGSPVQIEGGIPKMFRFYCQNAHSKLNNGRPCEVTTSEYLSLPEAVLAWNNIQIGKGFDARKLHPINL